MAETKDISRREPAEPARAEEPYRVPPVDIYETDESVVLVADMPGVGEGGLDVSIEKDTLSITGRVDAASPQGAEEVYAEFEPLPYRRAFTLSRGLNRDAVEGQIVNGVLRLTLPKADEAKVRKIPIRT